MLTNDEQAQSGLTQIANIYFVKTCLYRQSLVYLHIVETQHRQMRGNRFPITDLWRICT